MLNFNSLKFTQSLYILSLFLCLFFSFQTVKANKLDYRYTKAFDIQKISLDEGLSQSVVNEITQDSNGFIWIGTEDGLNRFDGYDFLIYQHDHKRPSSLHENWVISLAVVPKKGLWIGTIAGLSYLDFATEKFINYSIRYPELIGTVRDLLYLEDSGVWVATNNGLFFREKDSDPNMPFKIIQLLDKGESNKVIKVLTSSVEAVFVATKNCIFRINKINHLVTNLCDSKVLSFIRYKEINKILIDNNELWIATTTGLFLYNLKNGNVSSFDKNSKNGQSIASDYVQDLVFDSNNSIWVSTTGGVSVFNRRTHKFTSHTQAGLGKKQLSASDIISSYIDSEGLVWLGTYGRGVNLLNPNQRRFEHLFTQQDALNIDSNNTIHGIEKDQYENLWLASYGGGLLKYNLMTGTISKPLEEQGISYDKYVFSLKIDKNNQLWISTFSEVMLLDLETEQVSKIIINIDGHEIKESVNVSKFFEDNSGSMWLLGETGLYKQKGSIKISAIKNQSTKTLEFESWREKLPYSYREKTNSLNSMVEDRDGNYWIGGDAGILLYNRKEDSWQHFIYDATLPNSLSSNGVQTIYIDNQGFVWIGTADGLNLVIEIESLHGKSYHFERITTHEGLPSNVIYGIQQDDNFGTWISTNRGVVKFDKNVLKMDLFRSADGLSSDEFNLGGSFVDENNRIYFSSINGITSIVDSNTKKLIKKTNLRFVKIKLGTEVLGSFILNTKNKIPTKVIEYGDAIEIWVTAMTNLKFGVSRFRYRIKGFDNKWVNLGSNRKLFIAGLTTGSYEIEIQSRVSGESWSSNSIYLPIRINSDFFMSKQFIFLVIALLSLIFLIILILISQKYKKHLASEIKKQSLEKLRIKEIRIDNDSLIYSISDRDRTIARLSNELEVTTKKVNVERYRDISTGFYRFDFVLESRDKNKQNLSLIQTDKLFKEDTIQTSHIKNYGLVAIIEFVNYDDIIKTYGELEAKDFISQISIKLRRETNADSQFYTLYDGTYIILNASVVKQKVIDGLKNLCVSFNQSSYDIANGRTINCQSKLTYIDLGSLQIKNKNDLIKVKTLIEIAHNKIEIKTDSNKNKCSKELKILRPLSTESLTDDFDFDVLLEDGTLRIIS